MRRLCPDPAAWPCAVRRSMLVSADMAHALHPNYPGVHEENHRPAIHGGVVIKSNANQRYATTSVTAFMFRKLASECGVPVQNFVNRQVRVCVCLWGGEGEGRGLHPAFLPTPPPLTPGHRHHHSASFLLPPPPGHGLRQHHRADLRHPAGHAHSRRGPASAIYAQCVCGRAAGAPYHPPS